MKNIKLVIEYDGTNYHGWQSQDNLRTIQSIIESKLSIITKKETQIIGSGRTDAGVHALGQVANFWTESRMTPEQFKLALNSILPKDIVIRHAEEVDEKFHARYSAISRVYEYTILNSSTPSAFLRNFVYTFPQQVDIDSMSEACQFLLGTHDFSSFAKSGDPVRNFNRTIIDARCEVSEQVFNHRFEVSDGRLIKLHIEANAFLRGMVRAIAGTLLKVGLGKLEPKDIIDIIESKDRSKAGPSLPARGLCLVKVNY